MIGLDNDEIDTSTIFRKQENFAKFLIIESTNKDKPITSISPFVIEKQIEALIGTVKSVKKLRKQTLLVETTRKSQTENFLRSKTFFNLPLEVSKHKTLNSSKGIIRDKALKGESDDDIRENLQEQGVTAAKRFKVKKKGHDFVGSNIQFCGSTKDSQNFLSNYSSRDVRAKSSEMFQMPEVWSS